MALRLRRGTNAERLTVTPQSGEIIYVTDSKKLYVGDGSTVGGNLVSGVNDIIDDATPQLGGDLDLNNKNIVGNGNINITGTITATGNINLGDGAGGDVISVGGDVNGNLIPSTDESFNLGSASGRWQNLWASGAVISGNIDAQTINSNIVADDSTLAYNSATNTFNGAFTGALSGTLDGDVTGSVFADDSTLIVDAVNRKISTLALVDNANDLQIDTISLNIAHTGAVNIGANDSNGTFRNGQLIVKRSGTSGVALSINTYHDSNNISDIKAVKHRGTFASPASYQPGDRVMELSGEAFDGTSNRVAAILVFEAVEAVSNNVAPGRAKIRVANPAGTTTDFVFTHDGNLTANSVTSSFIGSLASDDSTMVVDNNGSIVNLNFTGNVSGTPGDTGTVDSWLQVVVNGATKYIPLYA